MAKPRVHEIAKEIGITSKELLNRLNEMGEYVRGPSSTLEAPVVRRIREAFDSKGAPAGGAAPTPPVQAAKPQPVQVSEVVDRPVATPGAPEMLSGDETTSTRPVTRAPKPGAPRPVAKPEARPTPSSAPPAATPAPAPAPEPRAPRAQAPEPPQAPAAPARPRTDGPTPSQATPGPRPGAPRPGAPRPGGAAPGTPRPGAPRPGAPTPGTVGRKPGAPRPGNNPFAATQGMGTQRPQRRPEGRDQRPAGPRPGPGAGAGGERMPRPGGTGGLPGMPRPNPAMMPKQQNAALGSTGSGSGPRRGGTGAPGRPRPGGGRPGGAGGTGGPGGGGFGGPPSGGPGGAPRDSIRHEMVLEGVQDYELLRIAAAARPLPAAPQLPAPAQIVLRNGLTVYHLRNADVPRVVFDCVRDGVDAAVHGAVRAEVLHGRNYTFL